MHLSSAIPCEGRGGVHLRGWLMRTYAHIVGYPLGGGGNAPEGMADDSYIRRSS